MKAGKRNKMFSSSLGNCSVYSLSVWGSDPLVAPTCSVEVGAFTGGGGQPQTRYSLLVNCEHRFPERDDFLTPKIVVHHSTPLVFRSRRKIPSRKGRTSTRGWRGTRR